MITLFTAAPGGGKTASMVDYLRTVAGERPIYAAGINGLTLPHQVVDPARWHQDVPDGAIIAIDEVQEYWRPAGPGAAVPEAIRALEKHRHRGIDVYMTTQHPRLVHTNVRSLVGRHVHIRDVGLLGRWWYEWPECSDNPSSAWKNAPLKKRFKLPKSAFALYTSASMHIKPVRSFPRMLIVAAVAIAAVLFLGWRLYGSISARLHPAPAATPPSSSVITHDTPGTDRASPVPVSYPPAPYRAPLGAPAFADAVPPRGTWPDAVAGCWIEQDGPCRCVTQEQPPRVIEDRPAMCLAVARGDLVPPASHSAPVRDELEQHKSALSAASSPST